MITTMDLKTSHITMTFYNETGVCHCNVTGVQGTNNCAIKKGHDS